METTTFMVTKAKRGIYQLFNFSLCGQLFIMWSDEDWDVASLILKTPTHLMGTNLQAYVELKSGTQHELTRKPTDAQRQR